MNRHPLLEGLVDYAGLFPPAELPFAAAVVEYAEHRTQPEAWMLGHFICPAGRLSEFLPFPGPFTPAAPLMLSVLPGTGESLTARIDEARAAFDRFVEDFDGHAELRVMEARMPDSVPSVGALRAASDSAGAASVYLEWRPDLPKLTDCLAVLGEARAQGSENLGAKIRCGGTEAEAFPSVAEVGTFIGTCASMGIPFKATAGLHHPVRHERDGFTMHGFLNVFGAATLALESGSDQDLIEAVLKERNPDAFQLSEGGFSWRGRQAGADRVREARTLAHAYGSCSFNEPREDLEAAHWFGHQV